MVLNLFRCWEGDCEGLCANGGPVRPRQNLFGIRPMLQIRRGNSDNLGIISHISPQNIFCDSLLQPSHQEGSNEGSQHMSSLRNKTNYL